MRFCVRPSAIGYDNYNFRVLLGFYQARRWTLEGLVLDPLDPTLTISIPSAEYLTHRSAIGPYTYVGLSVRESWRSALIADGM